MFSPTGTSTLGQRALGALGLLRSFLLLEDDYEVDWEVGQDERVGPDHPHRAPLRGIASLARRPGEPTPALHVCQAPLEASRREPVRTRRPRERTSA